MKIAFTILGEPASKANQRKPATVGPKDNRRTIWIKSDKARAYEADALKQIPPAMRLRIEGPVRLTARIWYVTERPDLDASLIRDILQDRFIRDKITKERVLVQRGVYRNDRQVREEHYYWGKDPANPRAEIEIEPMVPQQRELIEVAPRPRKKSAEAPEGMPF